MALRVVTPDRLEVFIPVEEQDSSNPTRFHLKPLTGVQYDEYQDDLFTTTKKGNVKSNLVDAHRRLIRKTITQVDNIYLSDGTFKEIVTDKDTILLIVEGLESVEAYTDLISACRGTNKLLEDQVKN